MSLDNISALNLSLISGLEKMFAIFQTMRMSDWNELKMADSNGKEKEESQSLGAQEYINNSLSIDFFNPIFF